MLSGSTNKGVHCQLTTHVRCVVLQCMVQHALFWARLQQCGMSDAMVCLSWMGVCLVSAPGKKLLCSPLYAVCVGGGVRGRVGNYVYLSEL